MSYVRSFTDYAPPARYDSIPFSQIEIQEGPEMDGPWTLIDTYTIDPLDVDPAQPSSRSYTTINADLAEGWYRLVWVDESAARFESDPIQFSVPGSTLATVSDVGTVLGIASVSEADRPAVKAALEVAEEWARIYLHDSNLGIAGDITYDFYDASYAVDVPAGLTVTGVTAVPYRGGAPVALDADQWHYDGNRVFIASNVADLGLPLDEYASSGRAYHKVTVSASSPDGIPAMIRRGVALAAAAVYSRSASAGKGVVSESLGDYSYQLEKANESGDPFFAQAKALLRPLRNTGPVVV